MIVCVRHRTHWSRCDEWRALKDAARMEWCVAETFEDVCRAWGCLSGRVTLHRHGSEHFSRIAKERVRA